MKRYDCCNNPDPGPHDPNCAAALNALLDTQNAATAAANAAYEERIRTNPALMAAARGLLAAAKIAAPLVAGAVGGPGAAAIATVAIRLADELVPGT